MARKAGAALASFISEPLETTRNELSVLLEGGYKVQGDSEDAFLMPPDVCSILMHYPVFTHAVVFSWFGKYSRWGLASYVCEALNVKSVPDVQYELARRE